MKKRMFSQAIIQSDAFLDMPLSTQGLYFHLSMSADDYGFVSPKRIMRMIGANEDDLKLLIAKRYVLWFDSGVVVIKHWMLNNTVRKDRSSDTTYQAEFKQLTKNEYGAYTELEGIKETVEIIENVKNAVVNNKRGKKIISTTAKEVKEPVLKNDNQMSPQIRLDYIRLDSISKDILVNSKSSHVIELLKTLIKELGFSDQTKLTDGRKAKLKARLRVFTDEELMLAAKNLYSDPYMQGDNDGAKKYGNIDYLLRNDEIVDKWLNQQSKSINNYKADW